MMWNLKNQKNINNNGGIINKDFELPNFVNKNGSVNE